MIKRSNQQEDTPFVNIHAPNIGGPKYIKQILTPLKGEIDNSTIIVGNFNTPLTLKDRSSNQNINKETQALNDTLEKMDVINTYRTFHPKATEYTFYSNTHGIYSRIDYIFGHKTDPKKFKRIETHF